MAAKRKDLEMDMSDCNQSIPVFNAILLGPHKISFGRFYLCDKPHSESINLQTAQKHRAQDLFRTALFSDKVRVY
jgi:hypothetical protein